MFLKILSSMSWVSPFERKNQGFRLHLSQSFECHDRPRLTSCKDEHQILNRIHEVFIHITNRLHQFRFYRAIDKVHDIGSGTDTTNGG